MQIKLKQIVSLVKAHKSLEGSHFIIVTLQEQAH